IPYLIDIKYRHAYSRACIVFKLFEKLDARVDTGDLAVLSRDHEKPLPLAMICSQQRENFAERSIGGKNSDIGTHDFANVNQFERVHRVFTAEVESTASYFF